MAPQHDAGAEAEAEPPEYAGHYRLDACLGSGGMGVVHLARSTSGMKVAVKVVHAQFAKDPEFRGRFRQEVAAARRVSGAFTASVVDADPESGRPWMATLFIPGPTLSDHVKRNGPMSSDELRRLMAGLAEALRDIHRVGVVHRDLKPSNVLLAQDGPKVIDFGISRPKDSELRTETGKLIGTPPFMAPEQFRSPREVGPAADVFALGSVMVHAATGRGPFDSDSPYVVAYQVVHDEPDLTGVPPNLAPLVARCLAKEPEDRPSPDDLMRALRSVAASYDTQTFEPSQRTDVPGPARGPAPEAPVPDPALETGEAAGRRARRRPGRGAVVLAVGLVLTLGVGLVAVGWPADGDSAVVGGKASPSGTAVAPVAWRAKPVVDDGGVPQCLHGAGKLLCAQTGVVFALDPADGTLVWKHRVSEDPVSEPPVLSGGLVQVWTERGRRVAGLDPGSGRTRWERTVPANQQVRAAGGMLLFYDAEGSVTGVDSASGEEKWSRRVPGPDNRTFVSFAGDSLAYAVSTTADGSHTQVTAVDPETGAVRWEARLSGYLQPVGSQDGNLFLLADDPSSASTTAVVRYTPASRETRRVTLPVALLTAQAGVRGNVVYLQAAGGALEAVDMGSGRRLWHIETAISRGSAPSGDGEHVYVTAPDGRLLAVTARDGKLVGQTPPRLGEDAGRVPAALPRPVLVGRQVFSAAPDGSVFAVDGRDPGAW